MNDETKIKAEAWDIVYPALIFLIQTGVCSKMILNDLKRSVDHYQKQKNDDFS